MTERFRQNIRPHSTEALSAELASAREGALTFEETVELKNKEKEITDAFLRGDISGDEYREQTKDMGKSPGVIERETILEYQTLLMAAGFSKESTEAMLDYSNAAVNRALALGAHAVFRLEFVKNTDENGEVSRQAVSGASVDFPESLPDDEHRKLLQMVIDAPHDFIRRTPQQLN